MAWFRTFGVPEEISSDGGPPFKSSEYLKFINEWGITPRLSSAYYPQSNGRAEIAVKIMKRALDGNVDPRTGNVNTNRSARAIMTHRNTPNKDTGISPSELLFGYKLRDHLPNKFRTLRKEWREMKKARELYSLKKEKETLESGRRTLKPLDVGDAVSIQNQTGNRPGKWTNTGVVVQVHPHRQYSIMIDGSRRVTMRNRKFVRKLDPYSRKGISIGISRASPPIIERHTTPGSPILTSPAERQQTEPDESVQVQQTTAPSQPSTPTPLHIHAEQSPTPEVIRQTDPAPIITSPAIPAPDVNSIDIGATAQVNVIPRRSMRKRTETKRYIEEC